MKVGGATVYPAPGGPIVSRSAISSGSEGLEHRLSEMTDLGIDASTHSPTALENLCLPTYNHYESCKIAG
jgi:hypothetical protein